MFGQYGFTYDVRSDGYIQSTGQNYFGKRKLTQKSFRSLSVVGVLESVNEDFSLTCHHNPFANLPIQVSLLKYIAKKQYLHKNPHDKGIVDWEPDIVKT